MMKSIKKSHSKTGTAISRAHKHSLITARLFGQDFPSFGNTESDLLAYKIQLKLNDEYLQYSRPKEPLISDHNKKLLF